MPISRIFLKPEREVAVNRRHPWVFSGAVARVEGKPQSGELVAVHSGEGQFMAWGHYSPQSQIRVRLIAWDERADPESRDFWRSRLETALDGRTAAVSDGQTTACRLVHAESDGIPGLVVDQYGESLVVQYLSAGMEARRTLFNALLLWILRPQGLYERSDADVREKEGLPPRTGLIAGQEPPDYVEIMENGLSFLVNIRQGHKTGFYLDQRENRLRFHQAVSQWTRLGNPPRVLNAFSYTGAFCVYAIAAGAISVTNVDTSAESLELGWRNLSENGLASTAVQDINGNAFQVVRDLRQQGHKYEMIVLDPPKFASSQQDVQQAARGYKDINMQAIHLLESGGLLFTFSCSGAISADLFQKIVFGAAQDAGRDVQIVGRLTQGSDHPVALTFPEGDYLKGLICRAL